jgi:hypothetical protein
MKAGMFACALSRRASGNINLRKCAGGNMLVTLHKAKRRIND